MVQLIGNQKLAFERYRALMEQYDIPKRRADSIFLSITNLDRIPYFFELDDVEATRIASLLTRDNIKTEVANIGRASGICQVCGRELTDPQSVKIGIGPVCAQRFDFATLEEL